MTMRDKIIAAYGESMLNKSILSIREGGGAIPEVLGSRKFKTALEIGTYRGVSAAEISQYVEKVHTIDLREGKLEYQKRRHDPIDSTHDRHEFWKTLGIDNIELHLVANDLKKAALIDSLDFDFAFIDGAHDPSVANDFALVKRCGTVLFHDYDARGKTEQDYVYTFIESLPKHQVRKIDIFAVWSDRG